MTSFFAPKKKQLIVNSDNNAGSAVSAPVEEEEQPAPGLEEENRDGQMDVSDQQHIDDQDAGGGGGQTEAEAAAVADPTAGVRRSGRMPKLTEIYQAFIAEVTGAVASRNEQALLAATVEDGSQETEADVSWDDSDKLTLEQDSKTAKMEKERVILEEFNDSGNEIESDSEDDNESSNASDF